MNRPAFACRLRRQALGAAAIVALLTAGLLAGCGNSTDGTTAGAPQRPTSTAACPVPAISAGAGLNLPDLTLPCLGQPTKLGLRQLPARPVVLNLWASWCVPCRDEMPVLQRVHVAGDDQVLFLGIATRDSEDAARGFVQDFGVTYASLYDPAGTALGQLGAPGLPLTLVLAPDGTVLDRTIGGISQDKLVGVLERAGVRLDRAALAARGSQ